MKRLHAVIILGSAMLGACGSGNEQSEAPVANTTALTATTGEANADRVDRIFHLQGTDAQIGAENPDCSRFRPAEGPRNVLGVALGMTTAEATSVLRCQFRNLVAGQRQPAMFHGFTDIINGPHNTRSGFSVTIPADGRQPRQDVVVYLAGPRNQERVFAIRSETIYDASNAVPATAVTDAVTAKYGALIPERLEAYPVAIALAQPDPFCTSLIGIVDLTPNNGGWNHSNNPYPWERFGGCGTRAYVRISQRDGIANGLLLMLIDFAAIPSLHQQEMAAASQARAQERGEEIRRSEENARQGGTPRL